MNECVKEKKFNSILSAAQLYSEYGNDGRAQSVVRQQASTILTRTASEDSLFHRTRRRTTENGKYSTLPTNANVVWSTSAVDATTATSKEHRRRNCTFSLLTSIVLPTVVVLCTAAVCLLSVHSVKLELRLAKLERQYAALAQFADTPLFHALTDSRQAVC